MNGKRCRNLTWMPYTTFYEVAALRLFNHKDFVDCIFISGCVTTWGARYVLVVLFFDLTQHSDKLFVSVLILNGISLK